MSRTLFWYIFKDLLRIFFMASGVLAGIMSFGGLLRPLTEHGLSMGQVLQMLKYFQPAMATYSLPIAALFATTIVYGRLSSDNEIVACRAAGISHLALALPAFILGLTVAILGLLLLCFIVPLFMLKAEKVVFSNVGQIVANAIERSHQLKMEREGESITVFAQDAQVLPPQIAAQLRALTQQPDGTWRGTLQLSRNDKVEPGTIFKIEGGGGNPTATLTVESINGNELTGRLKLTGTEIPQPGSAASAPDPSGDQVVLLIAPMFVTYEPNPDKSPDAIRTPRDFYLARQATTYINQDEKSEDVGFITVLQNACKFPRVFTGTEGGVGNTTFAARGQSLVRENTKFMDVWRLNELLRDESSSKRVRKVLDGFVGAEQTDIFFKMITSELREETSQARLINGSDSWVITRGKAVAVQQDKKLVIGPTTQQSTRQVNVYQETEGKTMVRIEAQTVEVSAFPDDDAGVMHASIEFNDAIEHSADGPIQRSKFRREFDVPMLESMKELPAKRTAKYYLANPGNFGGQSKALARERMFISNTVRSELHARASFALSCLILVMVGCALGMMFRSGNFLSAFALSVVPALICIALIITGQHTCENVPRDVTNFHNPFELGRNLIWSGNVVVAVIAVGLLGRLQRQ